MAVVKLNEAMLFQMGFDRVAIDALRHLFTQVGNEVGAPTLPQVSEGVEAIITQIDGIDQGPPPYIPPPEGSQISADQTPPPQPAFDIQGDQSPPLVPYIAPLDLFNQEPPRDTFAAQLENVETQIRSAHEEIAILRRRINDLEQGVTL